MVELGNPVFLEWLERNGGGKWKLFSQWVFALPFVQAVQEIPELLQEPRRLREWKQEEQKRQFHFERYESSKKYAFLLGLFNGCSAYIAIILEHMLLFRSSLSLFGIALLWYVSGAWNQRRWMKKLYKS